MKKLFFILLAMAMMASAAACTGDTNGGASQSQGTRQPNANQQVDAAYTLDDLIAAVKKAGCISGEPESLDVKEIGAEKGIAYGNVVFLQYDLYASNAYFDAYDAGRVTVNGKTAPISAINGPYFMVFLDGKTDQNAVKAFRSIGFGT